MTNVLAIAGCGALGCAARYLLASLVNRLAGPSFPYGTLCVNVVGAFLIGLIMDLSLRTTVSPVVRLALTTGFLGGFTTFSTFSYETFRLIEDGEILLAGLNVGGSVVLCLAGTWLGIIAARAL